MVTAFVLSGGGSQRAPQQGTRPPSWTPRLRALTVPCGDPRSSPRSVRAAHPCRTRGRLVRRHRAHASGRGRPAWLYELTTNDPDEVLSGGEYTGLASTLAATIIRTSTDPAHVAAVSEPWWIAYFVSNLRYKHLCVNLLLHRMGDP